VRIYQEIGAAEARLAIDVIFAELTHRQKAAAIVVADSHGEVVASLRMDGVQFSCVGIATNKAFTAARQREPSGNIGRSIRADGWDIQNLADPRFTGWDGGVPVIVDGETVGAVAVSGLTGEEDVEMAELAAARIRDGGASKG
jgi:glc operon protein GlcG